MPAFNPTGFTLLGDATVSSPMDVNTFVGEINPILSYFSGDIAAMSLFQNSSDYTADLANGYIYPYPISYEQTVGSDVALPLNYSKLGVFQYFTYTPVNTQIPIQSQFFVAGTQVAPNTKITATVSFSPTATFQAQISSDSGVQRNLLFTQFTVACDNFQSVTIGGSGLEWILRFPLGSSDKFMGGSRSYLESATGQANLYLPDGFSSVLFTKMTDIEQSGFSTDTNVIPNPIVQCTLTNNSLLQPIGNVS